MSNVNFDEQTGEIIEPNLDQLAEEFATENLGFAPYWNPYEGARILVTPLARDNRDPKFHRYILMTHSTITCFTGPAEEAEEVIVGPGGEFTMSTYAGLQGPEGGDKFLEFVGMRVLLTCKGSRKVENGDFWMWDVKISKEDKKLLAARRQARALQPTDTQALNQ